MTLVKQFTGKKATAKDKSGKEYEYETSYYFIEFDDGIRIYVDISDYKDSRTLARYKAEVRQANEH